MFGSARQTLTICEVFPAVVSVPHANTPKYKGGTHKGTNITHTATALPRWGVYTYIYHCLFCGSSWVYPKQLDLGAEVKSGVSTPLLASRLQ